jgi:PAS domain S-box-containing protein
MVTENRPHFPDLARVFEKIIEEANEAIYLHTLDPEKPNFIMVNREACQMLGYYRDELLARGPAGIDSPKYAAQIPERMRDLLAKGRLTFTSEHITKENLVIPVEITASVVEFFGQKYILSFVRDITDRLNLEKILHTSEDRFRRLSDLAPIGIFFLDDQGRVNYVNEHLISLSGLTFDEYLGSGWKKVVYVEDRDLLERKLSESIAKGQGLPLDFRVVGPDSKIHWVSTKVSPMTGPQGQVTGFVGIAEDITSLKLMHDLLTDKVTFIQQLIEAMPNPVFYKDKDMRYVGCNKAFEEILGSPREDFIGKSVYDLAPKDLADKYSEKDKELLQNPGVQVYESSVQHKNGTRRQVIFNKAIYRDPQGAVAGLIGVIIDITERKKQEEKYRSIIQTSIDGFWLADLQGNIKEVNDAYCKMIGYSSEELQKMKISDVEVMEKPEDTRARIRRIAEEGSDRFETRHKRKDGVIIDIIISVTYLKSAEQMFVFVRDITARKVAEENIINSQKLLQRIINLLPVRVFWKDKDLKYLGCNDIFAKDAGESKPEDLIGKDDFQMNWKDQAKAYNDDDQSVITSGKSKLNFEEPQTTPTGEKIWLKTSKVPLTDLAGNIIGILGTYEDITESKEMEEELKKRLRELESFNKVTLEREKRIIELKQKVKELEQELREKI